jgi:hypothetical protein
MSRKTDLEDHIRESRGLIGEYEDILRFSERPKESAAHSARYGKVGGGYIFVHRMLQEYFAELRGKKTGGSDA